MTPTREQIEESKRRSEKSRQQREAKKRDTKDISSQTDNLGKTVQGLTRGLDLFSQVEGPRTIDVNAMEEAQKKKRLEALEPIKDVVNWAEKLGSIYMLGNGLFRFYKPLSKFALRYAPSFYSGITDPYILKNVMTVGAASDAVQTAVASLENNKGGVVDNGIETALTVPEYMGWIDAIRGYNYKGIPVGRYIDNTFDALPYIQAAYDLTKERLYPGIESTVNNWFEKNNKINGN